MHLLNQGGEKKNLRDLVGNWQVYDHNGDFNIPIRNGKTKKKKKIKNIWKI